MAGHLLLAIEKPCFLILLGKFMIFASHLKDLKKYKRLSHFLEADNVLSKGIG